MERDNNQTTEKLTPKEQAAKMYVTLKTKHNHKSLRLPRYTQAMIAEEWDPCSTRYAYMNYGSAMVLEAGPAEWLVGRGDYVSGRGSYNAEHAAEIVMIKINSKQTASKTELLGLLYNNRMQKDDIDTLIFVIRKSGALDFVRTRYLMSLLGNQPDQAGKEKIIKDLSSFLSPKGIEAKTFNKPKLLR